VAEETRVFAHNARRAQIALVGGSLGLVIAPDGHLHLALRLTIGPTPEGERITAVEVVADPARLATLPIAVPEDAGPGATGEPELPRADGGPAEP
jgi:RNA polymerase sigma-70 factor (ECF subfamily)